LFIVFMRLQTPTITAHMRFAMPEFSFPDQFTRCRAARDGMRGGITQPAIHADSGKGA
jgi:hypothetical protein